MRSSNKVFLLHFIFTGRHKNHLLFLILYLRSASTVLKRIREISLEQGSTKLCTIFNLNQIIGRE